jgi:IS5 family transposase
MILRDFSSESRRAAKLKAKKPLLEQLCTSIPWESCRPLREQGYAQERKNIAGRKRIDPLILFRILILQQLFKLSDEGLEFQVNDRRSFEKFVGLEVTSKVPDATTVAFFKKRVRKAGIIEKTFGMLKRFLCDQGFKAQGGKIIDETLVPVSKQRNTREENKEIKAVMLPGDREENPDRLRQMDLDVRWGQKMISVTTATRTAYAPMSIIAL